MPDGERKILTHLRRIEGQIRALQQMVEERRGCEEVLAQVISARSSLDCTAARIVITYLDECLAQPPDEAKRELARAVKLLSRVG